MTASVQPEVQLKPANLDPTNSTIETDRRLRAGLIPSWAPWVMLPMRSALFLLTQAAVALALALAGSPTPWQDSIRWWPVYLILSNLINLGLLVGLTRREGISYSGLWSYKPPPGSQGQLRRWAVILLGAMLAGGVGFVGAQALLYGAAMPEFVTPLPLWAALLSLTVMPLSIALVELPHYFGYCLPRLEVLTRQSRLPLFLAAFWLALQHSALPLIFEPRFILYRFLSMLPLALYLGVVYLRTRRLGPLMLVHFLADLQLGVTVFLMSL